MKKEWLDIQYKPEIDYDKNYYTEGIIQEIESIEAEPEVPDVSGYLSVERNLIIDKMKRIQKLLEVVPDDVRNILENPLKLYMADLTDDKWDVEKRIIRDDAPPDPDPIPTQSEPGVEPEPGPDIVSEFPDEDDLSVEILDTEPYIIVDMKKKLDATAMTYQEYVDDLYRGLSRFWKESVSTAIHAGVGSVKDLQSTYKVGSQDVPDALKHVSDQVTISQIKRKQETLFFTKIYNIDKTIAHLRQNTSASELKERYFEGKDKKKSYSQNSEDDDWRNSKYITANTSLDVHQNETLADMRKTYTDKYYQATKNFYKYLMSSCKLTDGILSAYVKEAKSKAILKKAGVDINKYEKDEKELKKSESVKVSKRTDKAIEKTVNREAERKEQIASSIYKPDEKVEEYFSDFPFGDEEGGTNSSSDSESSSSSSGGGSARPYDGEFEVGKGKLSNDGSGGKNYKVDNAPSEKGQLILDAAAALYEKYKGSKSHYDNNAMNGKRGKIINGVWQADCVLFVYEVVRKVIGDNLGHTYNCNKQLEVPGGERFFIEKGDTSKLKPGDIVYMDNPSRRSAKNITLNGVTKSVGMYHVYIYDGKGCYEVTKWGGSVSGCNYQPTLSKTTKADSRAVRRY